MIHLTDHYHNYPLMIKIATDKGYYLWVDKSGSFWAEKEGWDFVSDNLAGLLGIIFIYEYKNPKIYKDGWWKE